MRDWLERTVRRFHDHPPRRAARASGYEAAAGTVGRAASRAFSHLERPSTIWEYDWDVLCLLDGCRLDVMREVAAAGGYDFLPAPEAIDHVWSAGSQSAEWMARTFHADHADRMARTAYVTGNPFTAQSCEHILAVESEGLPLSPDDFGLLYEAWRDEWVDESVSTIPPGPLTEAAVATWRGRADLGIDRVVVHYMQPHAPFRSRPGWFVGSADTTGWGQIEEDEVGHGDGAGGEMASVDGDEGAEAGDLADLDEETIAALEAFDTGADEVRDPWTRLRDGELPAGEFWAAYRDNLEWVLDDVARLLSNCDGRVILTSDHGNGAGEFGVWSHPPGLHLPAVRRVPWVDLQGEDAGTLAPDLPEAVLARAQGSDEGRRDGHATDEQGATAGRAAADGVAERLADLGYR